MKEEHKKGCCAKCWVTAGGGAFGTSPKYCGDHNCECHQEEKTTTEGWEERFRAKFPYAWLEWSKTDTMGNVVETRTDKMEEIEDFIRQERQKAIEEERQRMVERIERMPAFTPVHKGFCGRVADEAKKPMYGTNYLKREDLLSLLTDKEE